MIGLRDDPGATPPPPNQTPALVAKAFAENGWLQRALELEHRPQQEQMARAVAAAMSNDEALLFEAGTGVGKSLAYLIPGIIHAIEQSRQMIVSTHTISLQEQIETKDLPLCRRLFESEERLRPYAKFKSAVLLGKANYLCTTRLALALQGRQELFASGDQDELQRIRRRRRRFGRRSMRIPRLAATRIAAANTASTRGPVPGSGTRRSSSSITASSSPT
jgi:ATP-dependent DNA helicase DinG